MMTRRSAASGSGVPFLHEKQIERQAEFLLGEYAEKITPIAALPVPIEQIVEVLLGLTLEFKDMRELFPGGEVHGAIWFEDGRIGIEQELEPQANPSRIGRYHFTLAHEVGHWWLHRQHYRKRPAERLLFGDGKPKPDVICRSSERKMPAEWQADNFAGCLLMPRKLVHTAWAAILGHDRPVAITELQQQYASALQATPFTYRGRILTDDVDKHNAIKEEFCRPLAGEFQVSTEAMRIRLEKLNLIVKEKSATLF